MSTEGKLLYMGKSNRSSERTNCKGRKKVERHEKLHSPVPQTLIRKDLEEFVLRSKHRPDDLLFAIAIYRAREQFRLTEKVNIIHLSDIFQQDLDIWTESPGLPWRDLGYETKADIKHDPEAIRRVRKFAHSIKNGEKIEFPDCLAFGRSHLCDKGEFKVTAVWDYPATVTFIEAMFALPLIRGYQKVDDASRPIAYGFETKIGGMKKFIKRFRHPDAYYTGIYFKKFDKTVPPWLINIAFDILMLNICFCKYEGYGVPDARKQILLYDTIRVYFIETKIQLENGSRFKKFSGIPSGSYFTQLVGSVVNCVLMNWLSLVQFGEFPMDCIFLGDVSFISSIRKWNLEYCNHLVKWFGMEIDVTKSEQSRELYDIRFLGYKIGHGQPIKEGL